MRFSRHNFTNPIRGLGLRLRARAIPYLLPATIALFAVNIYYIAFRVGRDVDPGLRHIRTAITRIERETDRVARNWLEAEDDSLYIERLWRGDIPPGWSEQGVSMLLFRDTTMVYWSNFPYQVNMNDFWLTPSHSIRKIGPRHGLILVRARGNRSAVVTINLYNEETGLFNPYIFREQRIELLPTSDGPHARQIGATRVETDNCAFYLKAKPRKEVPGGAAFCGWAAILLLCLYLKNLIRTRTRRHNALRHAALFFIVLALLRVGLHYVGIPNANGSLFAKVYGANNVILGSLGDLFLTFGMGFVYVAFLFNIRAKLAWDCRQRPERIRQIVLGLYCLLTAVVVSVFHYALILSIYTPRINVQIYDIFDLSYNSVIFYLLFVLFVGIRFLMVRVRHTLFATRRLWQRTLFTGGLIVLLLAPVESQIRYTGYILLLFYLTMALVGYSQIKYRYLGPFLLSLAIYSAYFTFFATLEDTAAQTNAQRLYARILATSPQDRIIQQDEEVPEGELTPDIRFQHFTYVRVTDGRIHFKHGNDNDYQALLAAVPSGHDTILYANGEAHYLFNYDEPGARHGLLIVSRRDSTLLDVAALYAYTFLILFVLCGLLLELTGYTFDIQRFSSRMTFKIRTVVIGVVLFAMVAVTTVIIRHTMAQFKGDNRRVVNNTIQRLATDLSRYLTRHPLDRETAERWLATEQNKDEFSISLFSPSGRLIASSAYNTIHLARMRSQAYRSLHYLKRPMFVMDIGGAQYTSAFVPIIVEGDLKGYLNLQYYGADANGGFLRHELLADVLNLFLIILCISVILSEFLYRLLTKPFNQLHEAMRNISKMQKIDAAGSSSSRQISDEVGLLVEQYNRMIDYLEESYRQLARSEREGAWREMARQVAHEIKNPLTPMRLKIQMLQRTLQQQEQQTELNVKVQETLSLLLDQIDLLTKIASEFSDFAKMGEGHPTKIDLRVLLRNVASLYAAHDGIDLRLLEPGPEAGPVWVTADADHLTRVFVNICQNAVQAVGDRPNGRIEIGLHVSEGRARVRISDNGTGIPEEIQAKIFVPNFTTKSSGSGLGLPISRKIIELLEGSIGFESVVGEGTTFVVDLPIDEAEHPAGA
ncbi:HAMP domain-containing sensor histidine kinase [uncultured Rikenella sp.]|uniref:sensor histidine kinase n=1 Tax=uncultured Rikenella sp. TaxID=368003 RepID=UPI00262B8E97|nr:HAMP domain-containing sensor histidine kinase [uncultured Rikenella sp.]